MLALSRKFSTQMNTVKQKDTRLDTIGQRLRAERERLDMSQAAFGAIAGVQKNAQINYEADRRSPDANYLASITATGADITFILTGRNEADNVRAIVEAYGDGAQLKRVLEDVGPDAVMKRLMAEVGPDAVMTRLMAEVGPDAVVKRLMADLVPADPAPVAEEVDFDSRNYAHIPVHEALLSAGSGTVNGDSHIVDHVIFRSDWLAKVGVSERHAAMARVTGESMAPSIQPGDLVLIDTSRVVIPVGQQGKSSRGRAAIYAFVQDGQAKVKRIERPDARTLVLLSDNPTFPPELLTYDKPDTLNILGQLVWSGHVWR